MWPLVAWISLAALPTVLTVALVARYRFESMVGLRYLSRSRPATRRHVAAITVAGLLLVVGLGLVLGARGQPWALGTGAVLLLFGGFGGLGAVLLLRLSLFTVVSIMSLALGVAALIVVLAVTGGFRRDYLERVTAFHGHVVVGLYGEPTLAEARAEIDELRRKLADLPGLLATAPFAVSFAEVSIGSGSAALKGLDPNAGKSALARWMVAGDIADLGRPATCGDIAQADSDAPAGEPSDEPTFVGRIVLGRPLATRARAQVGQCVMVVIPFGGAGRLTPVALPFRVVGLFEMGFHQHDTHTAFVAMDDLRAIESARPFIYGLEMVFAEPLATPQVLPIIEARLGPSYRVLDWRYLSQVLFSTLETQRIVIGLFLSIIVVVSGFNLFAALTIVVARKTREIAILAALGTRPRALLRVFFMAGGLAGLFGTGVGTLIGLGICWLLGVYRFRLEAAVYMITELPIEVSGGDLLMVIGVAQTAALLATIAPVLRARRLSVVEGLRQV